LMVLSSHGSAPMFFYTALPVQQATRKCHQVLWTAVTEAET